MIRLPHLRRGTRSELLDARGPCNEHRLRRPAPCSIRRRHWVFEMPGPSAQFAHSALHRDVIAAKLRCPAYGSDDRLAVWPVLGCCWSHHHATPPLRSAALQPTAGTCHPPSGSPSEIGVEGPPVQTSRVSWDRPLPSINTGFRRLDARCDGRVAAGSIGPGVPRPGHLLRDSRPSAASLPSTMRFRAPLNCACRP